MLPHEIRRLRESLGMTQKDMSEYLCLKYNSQVSHLESGRTPATGPVLRLLELLAATEGKILDTVQMLESNSLKKRTWVDTGNHPVYNMSVEINETRLRPHN